MINYIMCKNSLIIYYTHTATNKKPLYTSAPVNKGLLVVSGRAKSSSEGTRNFAYPNLTSYISLGTVNSYSVCCILY